MKPPLLEMNQVEKTYPGVRALQGVSLTLEAGEVLAIVGENGAGKSTLIKILAGAVSPDRGEIRIQGQDLVTGDPLAARNAGIAVIYQEFTLVPGLSAADNIALNSTPSLFKWLDKTQEQRRAVQLFQRLGIVIDPNARCRDLSIAQQQIVEIAKALATQARVIVMDEPTTALTRAETERLFSLIRELTQQGIGIIYISHRLDEVFQLAKRVMVLRDGCQVITTLTEKVRRGELIELMVGRQPDQEFPRREKSIGEPRFKVKNLGRGSIVRDVSFDIRRGEVLGLTGLIGSGRTEVARLLFGADRRDTGSIEFDNRVLNIRTPGDAIHAGIALLTEDRKSQGLILRHSVLDNFALPNLNQWSHGGLLNRVQERSAFLKMSERFHIKCADARHPIGNLSGGNQQKVVLAKWLQRNCEVVIFDEPTRGIDVGAKYEIYQFINELATQGKSVLLISSEFPEILGMSDRVLVMHEGRISGEIRDVAAATQHHILDLAMR